MSYRRVISAVLLPATLLLFTGCTKTVWIGPTQLRPEDARAIKGVVTADGQQIAVEKGAASLRGDTLYADGTLYSDVSGEPVRYALDDLAQVGVERSNTLATIGLVLGAVGAVGFVVLSASLISSVD